MASPNDIPTKAQYEYLKKAVEIESIARIHGTSGIAWLLWVPGSESTGRECRKRDWVSNWGYFHRTTDVGREAIKRYEEANKDGQ